MSLGEILCDFRTGVRSAHHQHTAGRELSRVPSNRLAGGECDIGSAPVSAKGTEAMTPKDAGRQRRTVGPLSGRAGQNGLVRGVERQQIAAGLVKRHQP
ncbi:MAG TPA: hypothetical protein VHA07_03195, partial [Devosia sp.]|nr:hypothetical protein [Devosia sp.]